MILIRSVGDAVIGHTAAVTHAIQSAVRHLLEHKHLYQSIEVEIAKATEAFQKTVPSSFSHTFQSMEGASFWAWVVYDSDSYQALLASLVSKPDRRHVTWQLPDVKLFCKSCNRIEPFNGLSASNVLNRSSPTAGGIQYQGRLVQVYCLSYLCQSCKSVPEVFLLRRVGTRLTLCGRSPIEHVPVPKTLPQEVANFFSDAVVAQQSGQTLAGLFMLRTLCEQWTRRFAEPTDKADAALDKYMESLPDDFKGRFPSLRTIYSDLSAALHGANASDELFEATKTSIEEHFAARSVFKL